MGLKPSDTLETAPVLDAVQTAVERFGIPAILNSDQGSQFTSDDYKALLKSLDIRQSMDDRSRWADNIMIERLFRSLKTELIYVNEFHSPKKLRQAICTSYCLLCYINAKIFATCFQLLPIDRVGQSARTDPGLEVPTAAPPPCSTKCPVRPGHRLPT